MPLTLNAMFFGAFFGLIAAVAIYHLLMYAVLRVPATKSDEDWAIALLKDKSVLVHPGHFYDFPGEGHLVLSLITCERDFVLGVRAILELLN